MQKKERNYNIVCTYGALIIGIICGCFLLLISMIFEYDFLLDQGLENYNISAVMNISADKMLSHVLKKRLLQFLLFISILYVFPYCCASALFCGAFGFYYGVVITNLIIKYGLAGLMYGFVCFFPHYFLYFAIIFLLGKWKNNSLKYYYGNMKFVEKLVKIFVIIFLVMISLMWEIRFQKNFLNYFFQYLV